MTKHKKIGILLILIGVGISLILFAFADDYNEEAGFLGSVSQMEIYLWKTYDEIYGQQTRKPSLDEIYEQQTHKLSLKEDVYVLPYKYPFSLGIIFILSGIGLFVLSKSKKIDE